MPPIDGVMQFETVKLNVTFACGAAKAYQWLFSTVPQKAVGQVAVFGVAEVLKLKFSKAANVHMIQASGADKAGFGKTQLVPLHCPFKL